MKILINWHKTQKEALSAAPASHDGGVVSLTIQQREGYGAISTLYLPFMPPELSDNKWVSIYGGSGQEETPALFFVGVLTGLPRLDRENLVGLDYVALPENLKAQLDDLIESQRRAGGYCPLFEMGQPLAQAVLEGQNNLLYLSRTLSPLSLTNYFDGGKRLDISPYLWAHTLKQKITHIPFLNIDLEIKASWLQKGRGEFSLMPFIRRSFPKGALNTYTPQSLLKDWPKAGQTLGTGFREKIEGVQSGYGVLESSLELYDPPFTGVLNIYPTVSPPYVFYKSGREESLRLRRHWLKGKCQVGWWYSQNRQEMAKGVWGNGGSKISERAKPHLASAKTISLKLADLPPSTKGYFWNTPEGIQTLGYGLEIAKAHHEASQRCLEITFRVSPLMLSQIDLDTSLILKHPGIPGGEIAGKVAEYKAYFAHQGSFLELRLGARIPPHPGGEEGEHEVSALMPTSSQVFTPDYALENPSFYRTPAALTFSFFGENPIEGVVDTDKLSPGDMVEGLAVNNSPPNQEKALREGQYPAHQKPGDVLKTCPTSIDIKLKDLSTKPCLTRQVYFKQEV